MTNHRRNLINYLQELVWEKSSIGKDGYELSVYSLDDLETNKALRLYFEFIDRDLTQVFFENKDYKSDDIICSFLNILRDDTKESRDTFINSILKNAASEYSEKLQQLIDEICIEKESSIRREHGQYSSIDRNTGERQWLSL